MRCRHTVCIIIKPSKLHVKDGVGRGNTESMLVQPAHVAVLAWVVMGVG
jgi:hypothetical protein